MIGEQRQSEDLVEKERIVGLNFGTLVALLDKLGLSLILGWIATTFAERKILPEPSGGLFEVAGNTMVLRCLPFLEDLLWPFPGQARLSIKEGYEPTTGIAASSRDELPSWEDLTKVYEELYPEVPSQSISKARLRLFGQDKKERIILYRDDSGWCPFSEKVWLTLEEKQISYAVRTVNLSAYGPKAEWYYEINPKGEVPSIDHEGTIVTDSPDILRYIEANFPNHKPLWPKEGTPERKWIDSLRYLENDLQAASSNNTNGNWDKLSEFDAALDKYEEALKVYEGPWFFGHEFSGADIFFATIFERIVPLVPYFAGYHLRYSGKWPRVDTWFDELLTRKSFLLIRSDDYTTVHNQIRYRDIKVLPEGASWRAKIDGTDGSWDLPLGPIRLPVGSDDGTGANGAKEEAAKTLVINHENVTNFALRGVTGPNGSQYLENVDLANRFVAYTLLVGVENAGKLPKDLLFKEVLEAVEFFRDHIGVVRDVTFPAARQLRAHLQWLAKTIKQELKQRMHLQAIRYTTATNKGHF